MAFRTASLTASMIVALSLTAFAQNPANPVPVQPQERLPPPPPRTIPPQDPAAPGTTTSRSSSDSDTSRESVIVTGCIEREADFRVANGQGKGGPAGSGAGVGNEYILTHASTGGPVGTSGSGNTESLAYQLTGAREGDAGQFVNQRVELTGYFKTTEAEAKASSDLKLRQFDVAAVRVSSGTCN